jgi:hypothetical protein
MDPVVDPVSLLDHKITWMTLAAFTIWVAYLAVTKWWDYRTQKAKRAQTSALVTGVNELLQSNKQTNLLLADNIEHSRRVDSTMQELILRHSGAIDKEASLHLIDKFFSDLARDVVSIFTYSLENNGYEERPDFIRDRVKTSLAQSLESTRNAMSFFKFSVSLSPFFAAVKTDRAVERFVLCDILWDAVEPFYKSKHPLSERVEEMRLVVHNKMRDYLTQAKHEAVNTPLNITFGEDTP